jgi:hypothetical protein
MLTYADVCVGCKEKVIDVFDVSADDEYDC